MNYVRLGRLEDFPANSCRVVSLPSGEPVVVINLDGDLHVLEGRCGQGHSLEHITILRSEDKVLCPWHGWELNLERGVCSANPDCVLKIFPVRLERSEVLVGCG
jgi:nitrite reductase/ring-hydroxylating ferredoxin subunit